MRATSSWSATEATALRRSLEAAQRDMVVGPAPMHRFTGDPGRRGRFAPPARRWVAPVLVATVVVATVLSVALARPWSDPRRAREVLPASVTGPTAGSLADDTSTLSKIEDQFRAEFPDSSDLHLVLATDVAGARLSLARWPGVRGGNAAWLIGAQGAAASELTAGDNCDPTGPCWQRYGAGFSYTDDVRPDGSLTRARHRGEGVVVATVTDAQVVARAGNDVNAAGSVIRSAVTGKQRWPGVYDIPLPAADGRIDVEVTVPGGGTWQDWSYTGTSQDPDAWWSAASSGRRGSPVSDGQTVRGDLATAVRQATGMPLDARSRVLWSSAEASTDRAVVAVHGASGGYAVVAVSRTRTASSFSLEVEAIRPIPAGGLGGLAFAWSETGSETGLLGPDEATRARVTAAAGVVEVPLREGAGTTSAQDVRQVAFLNRGGDVVAEAPVTPRWQPGRVLGTDPGPTAKR